MSIIRVIAYSLLLLVFSSAMPSEKATEKFKKWYSKNASALVLKESDGDYSCNLRYIPSELKVFKELYNEPTIKRSRIKELYSKFGSNYEFSFKVSKKNVSDLLTHISDGHEDYTNRLFYLVEQIIQDFTLVTKEGELKPLDCHFENNYGAAPFLTFHLTFDKEVDNELEHLVYQDHFFGLGSIIYELNSIENLTIPKIK